MTFLHLLTLALGVVCAIAGSDLLGHRGIAPWPLGLVALALVPVAAWLYSPWIAAFSLGLASGTAIVLVASWTTSLLTRRRMRRDQARNAKEARSRQLDEAPVHRR